MVSNMGISVSDLAARVGCTRAALHKYLNGKSRSIEIHLFFEICEALNVSSHWLLLSKGQISKAMRPSPDQGRVLELYSNLSEENREAWVEQGEVLRRRQPDQEVVTPPAIGKKG